MINTLWIYQRAKVTSLNLIMYLFNAYFKKRNYHHYLYGSKKINKQYVQTVRGVRSVTKTSLMSLPLRQN